MKGHFGDIKGSYVITDTDLAVPYEYIYQNENILLRVDTNGLVSAQANPPQGIMLFKRDGNEKYSKWLTWVQSDIFNENVPISNFGVPRLDFNGEKPEITVTFTPSEALYEIKCVNATLRTRVMVCGAKIIVKTCVQNTSNITAHFNIMPSCCPYINEAIIPPWDKPEWYLKTTAKITHNNTVFATNLLNSAGDAKKRKLVTFNTDKSKNVELSLENFVKGGDFFAPPRIMQNTPIVLTEQFCDYLYGYPPIYAVKIECDIAAGECYENTGVISMESGIEFSDGQNNSNTAFFDNRYYLNAKDKLDNDFNELFAKQSIQTSDSELNSYVNNFLPLQMLWVSNLDRGWPTGMRGTRDAANDFMGMLPLFSERSRAIILELLACERSDGWFPRQISTLGKFGKHDLRNYVDGGLFVMELIYEYLCYTGDYAVLDERMSYLDSENLNSAEQHLLQIADYYTDGCNIGEHGLIKIYEGDWLDAVNKAGLKGRGESVTASCQAVMCLKYIEEIFKKTKLETNNKYGKFAQTLSENINAYAYNANGFYNSVFNDDGKWIFSDCDPDGECRINAVPNSFAIISGVAAGNRQDSVIEKLKTLNSDYGYLLFSPPLGDKSIPNVGRIASGDMPKFLWENGNVYNHGSNGFLARAAGVSGDATLLKSAISALLPYTHDTEIALTPPYAVVNCYQNMPYFNGRGGMPFLTGTIAMALRVIYGSLFGIEYTLDGLLLKPNLTEDMKSSSVNVTVRNKSITINYIKGKTNLVILNGKKVNAARCNVLNNIQKCFISYESLADKNIIEITEL